MTRIRNAQIIKSAIKCVNSLQRIVSGNKIRLKHFFFIKCRTVTRPCFLLVSMRTEGKKMKIRGAFRQHYLRNNVHNRSTHPAQSSTANQNRGTQP